MSPPPAPPISITNARFLINRPVSCFLKLAHVRDSIWRPNPSPPCTCNCQSMRQTTAFVYCGQHARTHTHCIGVGEWGGALLTLLIYQLTALAHTLAVCVCITASQSLFISHRARCRPACTPPSTSHYSGSSSALSGLPGEQKRGCTERLEKSGKVNTFFGFFCRA